MPRILAPLASEQTFYLLLAGLGAALLVLVQIV
jgi:hypothetical protein